MSVPHPGTDPNTHLYEQLRRDVLDRVPQIRRVEYRPNSIEKRTLCAIFDPDRLDPPTGPAEPELTIAWYRAEPTDWFRVDYADPTDDFYAGWRQDEDHPDLGPAHFQYTTEQTSERWGVTFVHETPSLVLWEIVDSLLTIVRPSYQFE